MGTIIAEVGQLVVALDLTIDREGVGGLTGLVPTVAIRNAATLNSYLDWADNIFKIAGWTTKYALMSEVERGHYQRILSLAPLTTVVSNSILTAEYHVDNGSDVIGDALDYVFVTDTNFDIEFLRKLATNRLETSSGNPGLLKLYDDDGFTVLKTWQLKDEFGGAILPAVGAPSNRGAGF